MSAPYRRECDIRQEFQRFSRSATPFARLSPISSSMPTKNVICIVVDRLHAGMVGAYGNGWIRTRRMDRLACESFLFDQAYVPHPDLPAIYEGYWRGEASLPAILGQAGWLTSLITDEPVVAELAGSGAFAEKSLHSTEVPDSLAIEAPDTQIARVLHSVRDWLDKTREPFCLWVHLQGMAAPWDAPWDYRASYVEEEDPDPPKFIEVPSLQLPVDYDPDDLLGIQQAYAGQVSLLDDCLEPVCDWLWSDPRAAATMLCFISARGFALGEHLRVGACNEALYNETIQVPWFVRVPDGLGRLERTQALVQPADLPEAILGWLGLNLSSQPSRGSVLDLMQGQTHTWRDCLRFATASEQAIRTPAWYLRRPNGGRPELYAKPGDRWEMNEVAKLLPDVVAGLESVLASAQQHSPDCREPLPELLTAQVD
jgi:arylsulfatase A-like enzyme